MQQSTRIHALQLLFSWLLANLLGYGLGVGLGILFTLAAGMLPWVNQDRLLPVAGLAGIGLLNGYAQSRALKDLLPNPPRRIFATLAGCLLALLVVTTANYFHLGGGNDSLLFAAIGAAIALPQWLLLRPHHRLAALWVPAGALGFLAFLWLMANPVSRIAELVLVVALTGALASLPSGLLLAIIRTAPRRS